MSQHQPPNGYLGGDEDFSLRCTAHVDCEGTERQTTAGGTECSVQVDFDSYFTALPQLIYCMYNNLTLTDNNSLTSVDLHVPQLDLN